MKKVGEKKAALQKWGTKESNYVKNDTFRNTCLQKELNEVFWSRIVHFKAEILEQN